MPKSRKLEELIEKLAQVRDTPTSEAGMAVLQQGLKSKYAVAVAQAAQLVGEWEMKPLVPELVTAFDRFLVNPEESDPGCRAKQAIADALYRLNYSDETLFLKGVRHVQQEPVWGGRVDTAPRLRGTCALGLVRMNYPQVMSELADLLADPEAEARIGAARAIAYAGSDQGVPLLRLRIKIGDTSPVLSECLIALLHLAPQQSLPLLKDLLHARKPSRLEADTEKVEAAALALSDSRIPEAFPILKEWWQSLRDPELGKTGLLAIATLRQSDAIKFLLSLISAGKPDDAKDTIRAMSIYVQDRTIWQQVCDRVQERQDPSLQVVLEKVSGRR